MNNPNAQSQPDNLKSWETTTSTGKHFLVLDGIRGIAILMVVIYHTFYTNRGQGAISRYIMGIIPAGWMGVPIFFVLSGFLISYPFFQQRRKDNDFWRLKGYFRRRASKIIPPYYLSILVFLAFYLVRSYNPAYFQAAWMWAAGVSNFMPPPIEFNSAYWSLIVEAHFYIILPLLFLCTRGLNVRWTTAILFLVILVVPFVARRLTLQYSGPTPDARMILLAGRFPCQLDFFAWGVLFSGIFVGLSSVREKMRPLGAVGYAGVLLLGVTIALFQLWQKTGDFRTTLEIIHLLSSISAFLMLFFIFDPSCLGTRLIGCKWLRFVGIVSFEWFLFHTPIVTWFAGIFEKTHGNVLFYLLKTILPDALTFVFSVFLYRVFSLPILNRMRTATRPLKAA